MRKREHPERETHSAGIEISQREEKEIR